MQDIKILKDATQSWLEVAESPAVNGELYIMTPYFTGSIISKLVKAAHEKSIYFSQTSLALQSFHKVLI